MHISEGDLRAYLDAVFFTAHELPDEQFAPLQAHLETCATCRELSETLRLRAQSIEARLAALPEASGTASPLPVAPARHKLEDLEQMRRPSHQKEISDMQNRINRIPRLAWVGLALVAVLAVALAFPPVRAIANDFLGLFRVEQIRVVEVDPQAMSGKLENSEELETLFSENVQTEGGGEPQELADEAQARALSSLRVRLPDVADEKKAFFLTPAGSMTYQVDLALLRAVLKELGQGDTPLPDSLDGAEVKLEVQPMLSALYGECAEKQGSGDPDQPRMSRMDEDCLTLIQAQSPTITAPPDLDVLMLGEVYLQLLGMSPEEAHEFASTVDWTTTFVVPVPRYQADHRAITVDGVPGTLIIQTESVYNPRFALLWVKDGIFYAMSGSGEPDQALEIANSLK